MSDQPKGQPTSLTELFAAMRAKATTHNEYDARTGRFRPRGSRREKAWKREVRRWIVEDAR
jgi:hypothetical protein